MGVDANLNLMWISSKGEEVDGKRNPLSEIAWNDLLENLSLQTLNQPKDGYTHTHNNTGKNTRKYFWAMRSSIPIAHVRSWIGSDSVGSHVSDHKCVCGEFSLDASRKFFGNTEPESLTSGLC